MRRIITIVLLSGFYFGHGQTIPSAEVQIKTALMAAPADKREGALVYGYNPAGDFVVLRKGTNELVCITDDPKQANFSASCYHKDLDPFMERGRELKKAGKNQKEVFDIREQEVKSGKLVMPKGPHTLLVFYAGDENYNRTTGEVTKGNFRYVVYVPYATAETTGLPLKEEVPGMPWLMDPGTHRAHIMISTPTTAKGQD